MRTASINRDTMETQIRLSLELDGTGKAELDTGCGFLNHMLTLFARHGDFDLSVCCRGDIDVDDHHSVEDIGICLGQAFTQALGDKRGITRYGQFLLPMDETLVLCACDLSGRDYLGWAVELPASIHIRQMAGENTHHILEAVFKGMGRALKQAVSMDAKHLNDIPSTKGTL